MKRTRLGEVISADEPTGGAVARAASCRRAALRGWPAGCTERDAEILEQIEFYPKPARLISEGVRLNPETVQRRLRKLTRSGVVVVLKPRRSAPLFELSEATLAGRLRFQQRKDLR